jgi:uncharacterized membrane protein
LSPVLALLSAFLYGVSMVLAKVGLKTMDTFFGALISMGFSFIGSLLLFIFFVPVSSFAGWGLLFFIIAGLSGPCLGRFFLFIGINRVGSSTASSIYAIKPLFSALAAILILRESMTFGIAVATLIMIGGLVIISTSEPDTAIQKSWAKKDLIYPLMAGAAYGAAHVFRKIGLNIDHDPMMGVVLQNTTALAFSLPLLLLKKNRLQKGRLQLWAWMAFGGSGFFSVLGQLCLFQALETGSVVIVSPLSAISPLFVIVMAGLFLRRQEQVTVKIILGAICIILGTVLLTLVSRG